MTIKLQHLRSSVLGKLPLPANIDVGQIAVNFNAGDPFLSIKDSAGNVQRLGGATVGGTAPATPTDGQLWVDTSVDPPELKMWDATNTAWISVAPVPPIATDAPDGTADGTVQYARQVVTAGTGGTPTNTKTWAKVEIPPGTIVSSTAPTTPVDNQLWFNTDDGRLYIYYKDADSSQWIDASPDNLPPQATEGAAGVAEIATQAEVDAGTDDARIVTPLKLKTSPLASKWTRTGTELSPATAGDDISTTGDVSAADGTFSGAVNVEDWYGGTTAYGARIGGAGHKFRANSATDPITDFFGGTGNFSTDGMVLRVTGTDLRIGGGASGGGGVPWNAKFTRDGYLRIGGTLNDTTNSPNIDLSPNGSATFYRPTSSSASSILHVKSDVNGAKSLAFYVEASGRVYARNTTIQAIASERRLKKNIAAIDSTKAWETIKTTPYYSYQFKDSDSVNYGPMADEVPDEMKMATDQSDDVGVIHTYDNGMLQARLYTALQTALTRIEALEAEVTALKGGSTK